MSVSTAPDHLPRRGNALTRLIGRLGLRLMRFRFVGPLPSESRFVLIGVPHTSNWDFVLGMLMLFRLGLRVHWIGKHTLFRAPFGGIMRWLGGIPINRSAPEGFVNQIVAAFDGNDRFIVGLSPEGTRKKVERWKTGFYRIAVGASVPIALGVFDFGSREMRLDRMFYPTGDMEADIAEIRASYEGIRGKNPDQF
jgi:1-acyl-sn-glycerol-3-phosphate acyltransferase